MSTSPQVSPLRPKQERFCRFIASGLKPIEAYISSGYSSVNAEQGCRRLVKEPVIIQRLAELEHEDTNPIALSAMLDLVHSKSSVVMNLKILAAEARENKNYSAAIRAYELLGRDLGMFSDKAEVFEWDGDANKLSKTQRVKLVASLETMVRGAGRTTIEGSVERGTDKGAAARGKKEAGDSSEDAAEDGGAASGGLPVEPRPDGGVDRGGGRAAVGEDTGRSAGADPGTSVGAEDDDGWKW